MTTIRPIAIIMLTGCLLAGCLLVGCHADETASPIGQDDESLILLSALTSSPVTVTRIGAADTYNNSLPEGSEVAVYIYDDVGTYLTGKVGSNSNATATWVYRTGTPYAAGEGLYKSSLSLYSHDKTPVFPKLDEYNLRDYVRIFAAYPNNSAYVPTVTNYTVTVPIDQTGGTTDNQNAIAASDLMTTDGMVTYTKAQCEDNTLVELQLKHRMAKVTVVFTPATGSDLTAVNMPTKFDVLNVYRSLTVTPSTGAVSTVTSGATTEAIPLKGSTTQSFFIPPQDLASGTKMLKFNILGSGQFKGIEGASLSLSGAQNFEGGKAYLITVSVDVDHITMTGTITSWTDGGTLDYTAYEDSIR